MKRIIAILAAGLCLAGCEDNEVARARNEDKLPPGCRIIDLDYGDLRAAVVCEGRRTNTSLRVWDDTTVVYDASLKTTTTQVTRHRRLSVEIGAPS